jgi:hypothetical protein
MPDFDIFTIPESSISVSGGEQLSGVTQGDGSHLVGETITINSSDWIAVTINDNDPDFEDNDGNQSLVAPLTYDGIAYSGGERVEAEYEMTVEDPDGNQYTLLAFNIVGPGGTPFGSVEGLAFVDAFPPLGVPLTVVNAQEGPGNNDVPFTDIYAPPCFLEGTKIATPKGDILVEKLIAGDLVATKDHGVLPLAWIGSVQLSQHDLRSDPTLRPVCFESGLTVSQQHRILVSGFAVELYCGAEDVLVPAKHFVTSNTARYASPEEFPNGLRYWHIMFENHQIVYSDGVETESFCPGPLTLGSMPGVAQEFARLFPDFKNARYAACRRQCTAWEAQSLLAAM